MPRVNQVLPDLDTLDVIEKIDCHPVSIVIAVFNNCSSSILPLVSWTLSETEKIPVPLTEQSCDTS